MSRPQAHLHPRYRPRLEPLEERAMPVALFAAGVDAGTQPRVDVYNTDGTLRFSFLAFGKQLKGGVRVAVGDVTGDGNDDIIAALGPGARPRVRIFNGVDQTLITEFLAFGDKFRGGSYVAAGNFDSDAALEVVAGSGSGRSPLVRVWDISGATAIPIPGPLRSFAPFGSQQRGGVTVAAGNIDGTGQDELIAGIAADGPPRIRAFRNDRAIAADFMAFPTTSQGGVFITVGNVRDTAAEEIIVGPGAGRGPQVRIFSVLAGTPGPATLIDNFDAYEDAFNGGVRVAAVDYNADGQLDIVTAPGAGRKPLVRVWQGLSLALLDAFLARPTGFGGGFFVGGAG